MNKIKKVENENQIIYTLRGALNTSLRTKAKNKTHKIFKNFNKERNLTKLYIKKFESEETQYLINRIKMVKPDLKEPIVFLTVLQNLFYKNILTDPISGTFISLENKNKYFNNIGAPISFGGKTVHYLRKGAGALLLNHVIKEMKERGVKTIITEPLHKFLEGYYSRFGFKIIPKVPLDFESKGMYYGMSDDLPNIMYLEL